MKTVHHILKVEGLHNEVLQSLILWSGGSCLSTTFFSSSSSSECVSVHRGQTCKSFARFKQHTEALVSYCFLFFLIPMKSLYVFLGNYWDVVLSFSSAEICVVPENTHILPPHGGSWEIPTRRGFHRPECFNPFTPDSDSQN